MVIKFGKKGFVVMKACAARVHGKNPHCMCRVLAKAKIVGRK
jgi:hypothetical protein